MTIENKLGITNSAELAKRNCEQLIVHTISTIFGVRVRGTKQ